MISRRTGTTIGLALVLVTTPAAGVTPRPAEVAAPATPLLYDDALAAVRVPGFAGVWVDGATLVVSLTRPSDAAARAARTEVARVFRRPDLATKPVVTRQAQYSFRQLKGWYASVARDVLALPGARSGDVDEQANVLRFGVADVSGGTAAKVAALLLARGVPAKAVRLHAAAPVSETLGDAARPLVGGVRITSFGDCTLAFPAERNGEKGFLTNSHCTTVYAGPDGTAFSQPIGQPPVGAETVDPLPFTGGACTGSVLSLGCRYADVVFVSLFEPAHYQAGYLARPPAGTRVWNGIDKYRVTGEASLILGEPLASVGQKSGLSSGTVVTTCIDSHPMDREVTLLCQAEGTYESNPGDSGAPVFRETAGTDVSVLGVNWGKSWKTGVGAVGVFSPIGNVQLGSELGALTNCATGYTC